MIDIMAEHERQHAFEIEQWRAQLDQSIDSSAVRVTVLQARAEFMALLDRFDEGDVLDKRAVGVWSVNDVVGHLADWEQLALQAAAHICDSSQPAVSQTYGDVEVWNIALAEKRRHKSWAETYHYLRQTHLAMDNLMARLKPQEWGLRGPYPWFEAGTVAELLSQTAGHYIDHMPALEKWYKARFSTDS